MERKSSVWGVKETKRANQKEGNGQLCLYLLRDRDESRKVSIGFSSYWWSSGNFHN